jgi:MSHA biogenesis protein MshJ
MMKWLNTLFVKGDALSPRERTILFILLMAGIWAVVDAALMSPLKQARQAETARMQAAQERMLQAQEGLALRQSQPSPDVAAVQRLEAARTVLNARMQAASQLQAHMVAPKDMAQVLRGLTRHQPGLRLVNLRTLPPEPLGSATPPNTPPANAPDDPPQDAGLYQHGVTLTLAGSYETLVRYMTNLEKLPVGFYWVRAELDASRHPEIELTLTLNTLSLERQWLTL